MDIDALLYGGMDVKNANPGDLLVAEPLLSQECFQRSVILLISRTSDTIMGLVMNHRLNFTMHDIMPDLPRSSEMPLFNGGPVELDRLFMVHRLGERIRGSIEVSQGIYIGGDIEDLRSYLNGGGEIEGRIRFLVGYSGWTGNQLNEEIEQNVWGVKKFPHYSGMLRGEGEAYWRRYVTAMGPAFRSWLIVPSNPAVN